MTNGDLSEPVDAQRRERSIMAGAFQLLEQCGDVLVALPRRQAESAWLHVECRRRLRLPRVGESQAEQPVDDRFEGLSGATYLLVEEHGDIVVDGQGPSHIMMMTGRHHGVKDAGFSGEGDVPSKSECNAE